MSANTYGRQVVVPVTNKSGGALALGDVVIVDTTNNDAVTTTTSAASTVLVGVVQETIASNATGRVLFGGYTSLVNVNASVTRGHYGTTHTVAKQAADGGASRIAGAFCVFLTGGTTPDALVYNPDLGGASLTNPMTTTGDIIYGGASGTPTRLAAVATGNVLRSAGTGTAPAWGAEAPNCYENFLVSANVTMTNANTFYDFATVTPAAGTYLVIAECEVLSAHSLGSTATIRIRSGSTNYKVRSHQIVSGGGNSASLSGTARVTVDGATAIIGSAANARGSSDGAILRTANVNGSADLCSSIVATRITSA